jgi:hypothetical protein
LSALSAVVGEEITESDHARETIENEELYVIAVLSVLLSICISLAGVLISYFYILEDRLMQAYKSDGLAIQGRVRQVQFFRRTGSHSEPEYKVHVDYKCSEVGGYTTIVRKEMTAYASDWSYPKQNEKSCLERQSSHRVIVHIDLQDFERELDSECSSTASMEALNEPANLEVLVIQNYPNSGIPKCQVDRTFTFEKRWPTLTLICFLFGASLLCIFWGLSNCDTVASPSIFKLSVILNVGCWLIGVVLIHIFLRPTLDNILEEEFLRGGNTLVKLDDETLATLSSRTASSKEIDDL